MRAIGRKPFTTLPQSAFVDISLVSFSHGFALARKTPKEAHEAG